MHVVRDAWCVFVLGSRIQHASREPTMTSFYGFCRVPPKILAYDPGTSTSNISPVAKRCFDIYRFSWLTLASNQVMAQSETGYLRAVPSSSKNIDGNVLNPIPILALDVFLCLIISWIHHMCVQRVFSCLLSLIVIPNFAHQTFIY